MWGWLHSYCFLLSIQSGIARIALSVSSGQVSCGVSSIAGKSIFLLQAHSLEGNTSARSGKPLSSANEFDVVQKRTHSSEGNTSARSVTPLSLAQELDARSVKPLSSAQELDVVKQEYLFLMISALGLWGLLIYIKTSIDNYLETSTPTSPPWFCDGRLVMRIGGVGVVGWFLIGLVVFTHVMVFVEERRHLTAIEAIYLSSQILTTVGYGDFTPSTSAGYVFIAFYTLIGVTFFGWLFAELYEYGTSKKQLLSADAVGPAFARARSVQSNAQHHQKGRYDEFIQALWPCMLAAIVGTCFFHYYPGEQKPFWQALYTSVISLTSVGFGAFHPVTQAGYLFTSIWLLLGVSATANMIVTLGNCFFKYRKEVRAEHMSLELLEQMDISHTGAVDKIEFLRFELVRRGLCTTGDVDDILDLFADLDTNKSGELEIEHLETLVAPASRSVSKQPSCVPTPTNMRTSSFRHGYDDE